MKSYCTIFALLCVFGCQQLAETEIPKRIDSNLPHCYNEPYAAIKSSYDFKRPLAQDLVASSRTDRFYKDLQFDPKIGRIIIAEKSLGEPPEISRIQKGLTTSFIGMFINDGLSSWHGIDLDRMETISVRRRVYDKRAKQTKMFGDPVFRDWDQTSIVRKWSDENRVEMEVVQREPLSKDAAEAFVCIANSAWKEFPFPVERSYPTDTLSSTAYILDRVSEDTGYSIYNRSFQSDSPINLIVGHVWRYENNYEWK